MCKDEKRSCITINCGCCEGNGGTAAENIYSTEETVCGTWIDGKPIYRKVISGTLAEQNGNGLVFANVSELQIDRLINLHGNMFDYDRTAQLVFPISYNRTNGLFGAINMFYGNETGNIFYHYLNNNGEYSGSTAYVILEYTKQ